MNRKFKMLLMTSRPISWVNTAYPFAVGYIVASHSIDLVFLVGTIFFLVPYNLALYGINDVFDYESDMRNPRKGGVEGAVTPQNFHGTILWASALTSLPFILFLTVNGSLTSNITLFFVIFFLIADSIKGLRFKEIPVLDSITSSFHFVGPLIYALSLSSFPNDFWPYVIAFFAWGMASHALGAVQDIIPDREADLHSIATVFGAANTMRFAGLLYFFASCIVATQGKHSFVVGILGLLYFLNVLPYIKLNTKQSAKANVAWKRFLKLNYVAGMIITLLLLVHA